MSRRGLLLPTAVLLSLGPVGGCSIVGPAQAPETEEIVLLNGWDGPLVYLAFELESAHLVDPNPHFVVDQDHDRLLAPGDSVKLASEDIVGDYRAGDDLLFFLYAVQDGEALLRELLTLTDKQLERLGFRVEIQRL